MGQLVKGSGTSRWSGSWSKEFVTQCVRMVEAKYLVSSILPQLLSAPGASGFQEQGLVPGWSSWTCVLMWVRRAAMVDVAAR